MDKRIFLVGLAGSGKTHISKLFEEFGVNVIHVGQRVKEVLSLEKASYDLIERMTEEDPYFVSKVLIDTVANDKEFVVYEGAKSLNDIHYFGESALIYSVLCPREKRLERIIKRARYQDVTDLPGLIQRDKREISYGSKGIILAADVKIENCWSDETIHMLRLEQLVRGLNQNLADSIQKHLRSKYSDESLQNFRNELFKNDEKAGKEKYWTDELNV